MHTKLSDRHRAWIANAFVHGQILLGAAAFLCCLVPWDCPDALRWILFAAVAAVGSVLKVRLPGVEGAVSVSALFVLVGIVNLSLSETAAIGAIAMLVQCTWRTTKKPRPVQVVFNIATLMTAVLVTSRLYGFTRDKLPEAAALGLLAVGYFVANTFPIAFIIGLTSKRRVFAVWRQYRWMLPYYVVGASLSWLIGTVPRTIQWELPIICLPLVYLVHRSNRTHISQIEQVTQHVVEVNSLHLRTIEALACAIDAKDHTTHDHLQRVQLYALEIGKDLGLSEVELDALRAAATLHDIGKLAVPESIISKPGKLSRSEFEKMKVHPVVGAEILERVNFPYPVVPIVRAHHERWDGNGYPYGLKETEIPIGARILSAVDCLDALASDRQYRRALPLDEAMSRVASEAGTAFDPAVVAVLQKRYRELEERAKALTAEPKPTLSVDIKIARGSAPAAGFENEAPLLSNVTPIHPVARVRNASAGQISAGLQGRDGLAVAALRLRSIVPYDAVAFYACENGLVQPAFVSGQDFRALEALRVPQGEGLIGWVAEASKPILNGNPTVEPGYPLDGSLTSALALPLQDDGRLVGVIALYRTERDAFGASELVELLRICPAVTSVLLSIQTEPAEADGRPAIDSLAQSA